MDYKIPNHVAVIQDGNRRFAWMRALPIETGHTMGAEKALEMLEWLIQYNVKYITLYLFSTENFKRSSHEVQSLGLLFLDKLTEMANDNRIHSNQINVKIIGDRNMIREKFSEELIECINELERATANYNKYYVRLAIAYGGRNEISTDLERAYKDVPVDIIMRTAGDYRTSNFMSVQANGHGALLYVTKKLFPVIKKKDIRKMLKFYSKWHSVW